MSVVEEKGEPLLDQLKPRTLSGVRSPLRRSETIEFQANMKIFTGSAHPTLAEKISDHLGEDLSECILGTFSNGESRVEIRESCRGSDAYVIQPICYSEGGGSVNDMLMELLIMISALKGASAQRITAVMPIYGYARQDKKDKSRAAITARLVADLLETAGIDRCMTVDLHASQIQGFFSKPMDNLYGEELLTDHMAKFVKTFGENNIVIVSPDAGGAKRATRVASKLGAECAIISKERLKPNEVSGMRLVGNVEGSYCVLVDDMADTCGTLAKAAQLLKEKGAIKVFAYVVHGVLSGKAIQIINTCDAIEKIVVTNTIPQAANQAQCEKLEVVDISRLIAKAIFCAHTNTSISALFAKTPKTSSVASPAAKDQASSLTL